MALFFHNWLRRVKIPFPLSLIVCCSVDAQEHPSLNPADAEAYQEVLQEIEGLRLDINRATASDLLALPWFSSEIAHQIESHRVESGPFNRLADLLLVAGMTREVLRAAEPYLTVATPLKVHAKTRARVTDLSGSSTDLQNLRISHRTEFSLPNLFEATVLTERDPGESGLADFWTGYVATSRFLGTDRLILGDFRPGFGQGLILSRYQRTSSAIGSARPQTSQSVAYRSSAENGALRGLYAESTWQGLTWRAIFSRSTWDAQIHETGAEIKVGGLHSTEMGQNRKDRLEERTIGIRLTRRLSAGTLGATLMRSRFNPPLVHESASSRQYDQAGLDWSVHVGRFACFGESALSSNRHHAWVAGTVLRLDGLRLVGLARRYGPQFHSLRGRGFSAYSGSPQNEWDIFLGGVWKPRKRTKLEASLDRYGRIQPQQGDVLPPRGERTRFRLTHRLSRSLSLRISFGSRLETERDTRSRRRVRTGISGSRGRGRLQVWAERSWLSAFDKNGAGLASGFNVRMGRRSGIQVALWATVFRVSDYEARIFTFVPSVWGGSQLLTLTGRGNAGGLRLGWSGGRSRVTVRYAIRQTSAGTTPSWAFQIELGTRK